MNPIIQSTLNQRLHKVFHWKVVMKRCCQVVIETICVFVAVYITLKLTGNYDVVGQFFDAHFWQIIKVMIVFQFTYCIFSVFADAFKASADRWFA